LKLKLKIYDRTCDVNEVNINPNINNLIEYFYKYKNLIKSNKNYEPK